MIALESISFADLVEGEFGTTIQLTQFDFDLGVDCFASVKFDILVAEITFLEGEEIALDLHPGDVYVSFQITADGEGTGYDIVVNDLGIRDVQQATDDGTQFLSIGLANPIFGSTGSFSPENARLKVSTAQSEP